MFQIYSRAIEPTDLHHLLESHSAGAFVSFEGRVRNTNEGKKVESLEYQIYNELALKEGEKILNEAKEKFSIIDTAAIHREGHLFLGDIAILIGTLSKHRKEAYLANKFIIDQIKLRLPIWKKEHYESGDHRWVFCKDHLHHQHFNEKDYYQKQTNLISQDKLRNSKVLVIGAGGLGCPVLVSLAQAGVGELGIIDKDQIEFSNLHRQFLFGINQIGESKSHSAKNRLREINPFIKIENFDLKIDYSNSENIFKNYDLIVDCTDNLSSKYVIHDVCFKVQLPFISGSLFKSSAIIRTFHPSRSLGCHRCQSQKEQRDYVIGNCNDYGIIGSSANTIGSLMANEVISYIETSSNNSIEHTILFDLKNLSLNKIKNKRNPSCQFCLQIKKFFTNFDNIGIKFEDSRSNDHFIKVETLNLKEIQNKLSLDRRNILDCEKGIKSESLARDLRESGFSNVYFLEKRSCCP
jgi:molybdopterin/thiamine biosynthesis adenylyltransferase/molybdopterin synthase catalytic subunit